MGSYLGVVEMNAPGVSGPATYQLRPHHIAIWARVLNKNLRHYHTQETYDYLTH